LVPGKYTADELVRALNAMTIHFETGSANISSDSLDILGVAANALKSAPAGTRVEIGGHTDNTGDAAANLKLSEDRANAVRTKLVDLGVPADLLTSKGYGDTKPVADNSTDDGRAKNRRMEFTVVR
jgi:outer membrane protein OmpA-like peptidoglycan-associated protein